MDSNTKFAITVIGVLIVVILVIVIIVEIFHNDCRKKQKEILHSIRNEEAIKQSELTLPKSYLANIYTELNKNGYKKKDCIRTNKYIVMDKKQKYHSASSSTIGTINNGIFIGSTSSSSSYTTYKLCLTSPVSNTYFWKEVSFNDYCIAEIGKEYVENEYVDTIWYKEPKKEDAVTVIDYDEKDKGKLIISVLLFVIAVITAMVLIINFAPITTKSRSYISTFCDNCGEHISESNPRYGYYDDNGDLHCVSENYKEVVKDMGMEEHEMYYVVTCEHCHYDNVIKD